MFNINGTFAFNSNFHKLFSTVNFYIAILRFIKFKNFQRKINISPYLNKLEIPS